MPADLKYRHHFHGVIVRRCSLLDNFPVFGALHWRISGPTSTFVPPELTVDQMDQQIWMGDIVHRPTLPTTL